MRTCQPILSRARVTFLLAVLCHCPLHPGAPAQERGEFGGAGAEVGNGAKGPGALFRRGDANGDGAHDISDAILTLSCLFRGASCPDCRDAADANDDGAVDISDPIFTLGCLFLGPPCPPPPSFECGIDPSPDGLDCASFPPCGRPAELRVTLRYPSGSPAAGRSLSCNFLAGGRGISHLTVATDRDGQARFPKPEGAEEALVTGAVSRHQVLFRTFSAELSEFEATLEPAAPLLEGALRDEEGQPVWGARVIPLPAREFGDLEVASDGSGSFSLDHLPPGVEGLAVRHAEFAPAWAAARSGQVLILTRGSVTRGTVREARTGAPLASARVAALRLPGAGETYDPSLPERAEATSDGSGLFAFQALRPGLYEVSASLEGYFSASLPLEVPRERMLDLRLHAHGDAALEVRVTSGGSALKGALVTAFEPASNLLFAAQTDGEGVASLRPVPPLPLVVVVAHDGYLKATLPALMPGPRAEVELQRDPATVPTGSLRVEASAAGGLPLTEIDVLAVGPRETRSASRRPDVADEATIASGLTVALPPDPYQVLVRSGPRAASARASVASSETTVLRLALDEGAVLDGAVLLGGEPQAGVRVSFCAGGAGSSFVSEETGAEGRFTLGPLPPGFRGTLEVASAQGQLLGVFAQPPLESGEARAARLELRTPAAVRGVVRARGRPAARQSLRLTGGDSPLHGELTYTTATALDGSYSFPSVAPARYTVLAGYLVGGVEYWWPVGAATATAGDTLTFDLQLPWTQEEPPWIPPETCRCRWTIDGPHHQPTQTDHWERWAADRKTREYASWHVRGALIANNSFAWINRPWRFGVFGINYPEATADDSRSGTSHAGILLTDKCSACRPEIEGVVRVKLHVFARNANLVGAVATADSFGIASMAVRGDLHANVGPHFAQAIQEQQSAPADLISTVGPKVVEKDSFEVTLLGLTSVHAHVWALVGWSQGVANTGPTLLEMGGGHTEFKINYARCKGLCNHAGGCPEEREVVLIK